MGRPRTRSIAKSGVDHNEDIRETEHTEEEILSIEQPKLKRQNKLNGQNEQGRIKKGTSIGRPKKSQLKKRLLPNFDLKHTKRKSNELRQMSNLVQNIADDDEDELIEKDYDNEEYDEDYVYDEDEIMFEEVDDPKDKDYSPKDYSSSYKKSRGKNSVLGFHRTPGTKLSNGNSKNPVHPEVRDSTQESSSSGNIPNLVDPSMITQISPKVSLSYDQNQSQSHNHGDVIESASSHSRTVEPINQISNNCTPMHQNQLPNETQLRALSEESRDSQSSQNGSNNNPPQTNNIPTRNNTLDQYSNQPSSMNEEPYTDADDSNRDNNTSNTTHISEPQETGRTSCDICNSTGCTTQKTSTTITIKMTTVTEADQYGNMTTRTFIETDISPVTGTIESSEQTEITVETSEHPPPRSNLDPTNSPVVTDQNRSNETSSPVILQETEVQESEKNQNHTNQQQRTTIDPISDPVSDPVSGPVSDPISDPVSDPIPDPISDPFSGPVDPVSDPIDPVHPVSEPEPDPDPVDHDSSPDPVPSPKSINPICEAIPKPLLKSISKSTQKSNSKSIPKSIPQFGSQNLHKITAGFSSCPTQSQDARLENANVMQHNKALQSLLTNSSQDHHPKGNRPTLPTRHRSLLPRPERLKDNIEGIVNPVDLSTKDTFINPSNQTPNLENSTNSTNDVVRTNSSPRDINGILDNSPDAQQSQRDSIKKKSTTRKRLSSKSIASPASKRKNQKIMPNKSPSEHKVIVSPYMMKAGNTFAGSNSSMQEVTSLSTEICSPQQNSPYKSTSATPPHPPTLDTNVIVSTSVNTIDSTNSIPTITPPHNNSSEKSRGTASTTPHSNSTIQPSNSSTPQVSSSNNTCVTRDSVNNPFVIPELNESSSENTPMVHHNNNEILVRSGSSSKTISTNGGGVGYNSRSSSVANSIEALPNYYHILPIEAIGSVTDVWNEWNEGINGNPSVILMMEQYGDKWVYENEYHLKKRRIIVKEVQVRSEQIGIYEALAELEKLRGENSLLWLADRIRTREQEEKVKT